MATMTATVERYLTPLSLVIVGLLPTPLFALGTDNPAAVFGAIAGTFVLVSACVSILWYFVNYIPVWPVRFLFLGSLIVITPIVTLVLCLLFIALVDGGWVCWSQ
jgi:hypothetical protein